MRSAAAAFAWEFQRRLRWGLVALGTYLAVLALVQFVICGPHSPIHPLRSVTFAFTVNVPLTAAWRGWIGWRWPLTRRWSRCRQRCEL